LGCWKRTSRRTWAARVIDMLDNIALRGGWRTLKRNDGRAAGGHQRLPAARHPSQHRSAPASLRRRCAERRHSPRGGLAGSASLATTTRSNLRVSAASPPHRPTRASADGGVWVGDACFLYLFITVLSCCGRRDVQRAPASLSAFVVHSAVYLLPLSSKA